MQCGVIESCSLTCSMAYQLNEWRISLDNAYLRISAHLKITYKGKKELGGKKKYIKNSEVFTKVKTIPLFHKSSKQGRRPAWLNKELPLEVGQKKKIYDLWKQDQALQWVVKDMQFLGENMRNLCSACVDIGQCCLWYQTVTKGFLH